MSNLNEQIAVEDQSALYTMGQTFREVLFDYSLPHVQMRPQISIDGNQWCALYGENLQDGVAGFGDSPYHAMSEFDAAWYKKLG